MRCIFHFHNSILSNRSSCLTLKARQFHDRWLYRKLSLWSLSASRNESSFFSVPTAVQRKEQLEVSLCSRPCLWKIYRSLLVMISLHLSIFYHCGNMLLLLEIWQAGNLLWSTKQSLLLPLSDYIEQAVWKRIAHCLIWILNKKMHVHPEVFLAAASILH